MLTIEIAIAHRNESLFRSIKNAEVYGSKFNDADLIFFCFFFLIKQKKESGIILILNSDFCRSFTPNKKINAFFYLKMAFLSQIQPKYEYYFRFQTVVISPFCVILQHEDKNAQKKQSQCGNLRLFQKCGRF